MEELNNINPDQNKRPQILTVFLIFSLLYGSLSSFSNLVVYGAIDFIRQTFEGKDTVTMMGMDIDLSMFLNIDKNFFLLQGILYAISFTGAILMWNFRKIGFHLYTLAQIILLIVASVFLKGMPFPWFDILMTAMFVYVYAKNLKLMQ